uniref:hypothetical protein n=1 Tax=Okeania sp. SIO2F4 TaxID=2607790 RepID=UPI0025DDD0EF|nr:hypothetical protein [Okeania sp. SIO2F4]
MGIGITGNVVGITAPLSGQNPNFLNLSYLKAGTFYDENKVQVFQLKKQRNRVY